MIGRVAAIFTAIVVIALVWLAWRDWKSDDDTSTTAQATADGTVTGPDGVPLAPGVPGAPGAAAGAKPRPTVMTTTTESGVKITIRQRPRIAPLNPPYAAELKAIEKELEAGEPVARYKAGLALYECRDVPIDRAVLDKEVEEIHQTRKHQGWEVTDPVQEERSLRAAYKACQGVTAEQRERFREYLKGAADAGLLEAQLDLMYRLPKGEYCQYIEDCSPQAVAAMATLRDEARQYVQKALEAGSVDALRTVAGWHLNEEMGTPNEVEAYAYFLAYDEVQKAFGLEREVAAMLTGLKKRLRPVDLEQAQAKAKELLSNPKCCLLTK